MSTSVRNHVTVGDFSSKESLISEIDRSGKCVLTAFARFMLLNDPSPNPQRQEHYELICCSVEELLPQKNPKFASLKQTVKGVNGLCPSQLAAYYCLQIGCLGEANVLHFMMEPINNSNDDPCIFKIVETDGTRVLNGFCAFNSTILDPISQIVYVYRPH